MKYNKLGNTDIEVSKLCFGGLTVGPLQKNLSTIDGGKVIKKAFDLGVNFIDTAELYKTYGHIKEGMKGLRRSDIIISSKSYAYDLKTAKKAVDDALKSLDTDYIDVFMMHEQESEHTVRGHYEALEYYLKLKEKGIIRAVGLSTHAIEGVKAANKYSDVIDVIHPILNISGLGILDGSVEDMISEIKKFRYNGGGVFSMKPLGGGNLLNRIDSSFDFILDFDFIDSIAVGMQNTDEVISNVRRFSGQEKDAAIDKRLKYQRRELKIADWCIGCNKCVEKCSHGALSIGVKKPIIDSSKCVLCGYCASVCSEFCIKVV